MRRMLLLAVLLFVAAPVAGQMTFDEGHQVRVAFGDIPTTQAAEPADLWNFHETITVDPAGDAMFTLPAGHSAAETPVSCDCEITVTDNGDGSYTAAFPGTYNGTVDVRFAHNAPGDLPFTGHVAMRSEWVAILYVPAGTEVDASQAAEGSLPCTTASCDFYWYTGAQAGTFAFTVSEPSVIAPGPTPVDGSTGGFDFIALVIGLAAGALVWAVLVQQGLVQKRSRKQVAATAAHKEVAQAEPKDALEARKRLLMAALKELELAKMNKEVETEVYDRLKAEYKKQTVTVMRALEETP